MPTTSNLVQIGDLVLRGQTIAKVGCSGRAMVTYAHFRKDQGWSA
jgi:murein DD-endopeptidase MepM/ murein hydrolase activator NlpD